MNDELNLCEILKGHEGETFYCSLLGHDVVLRLVDENSIRFMGFVDAYSFNPDGSYIKGGECQLFPSKDQRDWIKWDKEHNTKTPKTWDELVKRGKVSLRGCQTDLLFKFSKIEDFSFTQNNTPIEKSALALLKIYQLIEVGYGGNVINRDKVNFYTIQWSYESNRFVIRNFGPFLEDCGTPLCFHTKKQAIEFLSYPENVELLKDYFFTINILKSWQSI